jgi:hypothetical protein
MSLANRTAPTVEEFAAYKQRFSNWGRWGPEDERGTLNFVTPEVTRTAAKLARAGRTVSLARPIATAAAMAGPRNRQPADHRMQVARGGSSDYVGVSYHGFANTHIDGLCHIFTADEQMYNGRSSRLVAAGGAEANSVDRWRNGIVTRGVLYDVARFRGVPHIGFDTPVHGWELADIAAANGLTPRSGDAVIVRCGARAFWDANPDFAEPWKAPGLHASVIEFLHETEASLLCWDLMRRRGRTSTGLLPCRSTRP